MWIQWLGETRWYKSRRMEKLRKVPFELDMLLHVTMAIYSMTAFRWSCFISLLFLHNIYSASQLFWELNLWSMFAPWSISFVKLKSCKLMRKWEYCWMVELRWALRGSHFRTSSHWCAAVAAFEKHYLNPTILKCPGYSFHILPTTFHRRANN